MKTATAKSALRIDRDQLVVRVEQKGLQADVLTLENLHVGETERVEHEAFEQVVDDERGVNQAEKRLAPLFGGAGRHAVLVNGNEVVKARPIADILHEGDALGEGGFAGLDGALDGGTAFGFRSYVETASGQVGFARENVFDDVEIGCVAGGADVEIRGVVGAGVGDELVEVFAPHAFDETKSLHAGKFVGQIARGDVGGKLGAADVLAGGIDAARAFEAVNGQVNAPLHVFDHAVGDAPEAKLGLL